MAEPKREGEEELLSQPLSNTLNARAREEMEKIESQLSQPLDTPDSMGETKNSQADADTGTDSTHAITNVDIKTGEGEKFLQSSSVSFVTTEETSGVSKGHDAADKPNHTEREMSKKENLEEENVIDLYTKTLATKEAPLKDNEQTAEEALTKLQKDENGGIMIYEKGELESSKQMVNIMEGVSGQTAGAMIPPLDLTEDPNEDTGSLREACEIEESRRVEKKESSEEDSRGIHDQGGEENNSEMPFISVVKKMDPEAARQSEERDDDRRGGEKMLHTTREVFITRETSDNQGEQEEKETGEGAMEMLCSPLITASIEEPPSGKAGNEGGTQEDDSNITLEVRSQETIESRDKELTSTENDTKNKSLKSSVEKDIEDICYQKLEKTGKSQKEVESPDDILQPKVDELAMTHLKSPTSTGVMAEDTIKSEGQIEIEPSLHAEQFKQGIEPENEIRDENLEQSLDRATEGIQKGTSNQHSEKVTYFHEREPIDDHDEKNLLKADSDENIEIEKADINSEIANHSSFSNLLVEETIQFGEGKQDQVPHAEPEELDSKLRTEAEKLFDEAYEETPSPDSISAEYISTEQETYMELTSRTAKTDVDKLEKVFQLDCKEEENNVEEEKHEEGSDKEREKIAAYDFGTDRETSNIKEEVNEGPQIADKDEDPANQMTNKENSIAGQALESRGEETVSGYQEDETKAEVEIGVTLATTVSSKGLTEEVQVEENQIQHQDFVPIGADAIAVNSKEDEMTTKVPAEEAAEEHENAEAIMETEKQNKESTYTRLHSSTVGEEKDEEDMEKEDKESKEEDKSSGTEHKEQNFDANPMEETKAESLMVEAKPKQECNEQGATRTPEETTREVTNDELAENSSLPPVCDNGTKVEVSVNAPSKVMEETEETSLTEVEPEKRTHSDSHDLDSEEKGLTTTEQQEARLDDVDITAKLLEASNFRENKNMLILQAFKGGSDEAEGEKEHDRLDTTHGTLQAEVSTCGILQDHTSEQNLSKTITVSETTDEMPEKVQASYVKAESSLAAKETDAKFLQDEDESLVPREDSHMTFIETEHQSTSEEVQDEEEQLYMDPAVNAGESTIGAREATDKKSLQVEDEPLVPREHAHTASIKTEETELEEVQDEDEQLYAAPAVNSGKSTIRTAEETEEKSLQEGDETSVLQEDAHVSSVQTDKESASVGIQNENTILAVNYEESSVGATEEQEEKFLQEEIEPLVPREGAHTAYIDTERESAIQEIQDEDQQLYKTPTVNSKESTIGSVEETEKEFLQQVHEPLVLREDAHVAPMETEKESASDEVQDEDKQLYTSEETSTGTEDAELPENTKASEVMNCSETESTIGSTKEQEKKFLQEEDEPLVQRQGTHNASIEDEPLVQREGTHTASIERGKESAGEEVQDEGQQLYKAHAMNSKESTTVAEETEEEFLQKEDEPLVLREDAHVVSLETEKESASGGVQDEDQQLYKSEGICTGAEDAQLLENIKAIEVVNCSETESIIGATKEQEEKFLQDEDEPLVPREGAHMMSTETEKGSASEEVQDDDQQLYKAPAVNSKGSNIGAAEETKEKLVQKEDEPLVPREDAHVESIKTEKESASEEVQDEDQQLYTSDEITTGGEELDLLQNIKAREVLNCSENESTIGATEEQEEKLLHEEDEPLVPSESAHTASIGTDNENTSEEVQDQEQQLYKASAVTKESIIGSAEEIEEMFLQKEDEPLVLREDAHVAFIETEKETASEEVQDEDQQLHTSEKISTGAEDIELLQNIKPSEVVHCSEIENIIGTTKEQEEKFQQEEDEPSVPREGTPTASIETEEESASEEVQEADQQLYKAPAMNYKESTIGAEEETEEKSLQKEDVPLVLREDAHVASFETEKERASEGVQDEDQQLYTLEEISTGAEDTQLLQNIKASEAVNCSETESTIGTTKDQEEKFLRDEDEPLIPREGAHMATIETEKESESEEVQDEDQQLYKAPAVNSKESTIGAAEETKEKFVPKEDDPLVPREDAHVECIETEKESAREEVQLYTSDEITTGVEEAELLENIKASEVLNCSENESTIGTTEEQEEKLLHEEDEPLVPSEGAHTASIGTENENTSEEVQDQEQQLYKASAVTKESIIGTAEGTEEMFLQREDESLVLQEDAHVAFIETEKETTSEEVQDENQQLYTSEKISTGAEDVELLQNIKPSEVVHCSEKESITGSTKEQEEKFPQEEDEPLVPREGTHTASIETEEESGSEEVQEADQQLYKAPAMNYKESTTGAKEETEEKLQQKEDVPLVLREDTHVASFETEKERASERVQDEDQQLYTLEEISTGAEDTQLPQNIKATEVANCSETESIIGATKVQEEKFPQDEDEPLIPREGAHMASIEREKESASVEVQDEDQQLYKAPAANSKEGTIGPAEETKERFVQKEDDTLVPKEDSHVESIETEKESASEEVQDEDQQLYTSDEITTGVEEAELLENIKASEVINCSENESTIGATEEQEEKLLHEEDEPLVPSEGAHTVSIGTENENTSEEVQDQEQRLYKASAVTTESIIGAAEETEEMFLQKEDEPLVLREDAHVVFIETEKETASEEVQDEDQQLYTSEKISTGAEDVELLQHIKPSEVVHCSETESITGATKEQKNFPQEEDEPLVPREGTHTASTETEKESASEEVQEEDQRLYKAPAMNSKESTIGVAEETEEKLLQKEDVPLVLREDAHVVTFETEKESASEGVQHGDQQMYTSEEISTGAEGTELLENIEANEVVNCNETESTIGATMEQEEKFPQEEEEPLVQREGAHIASIETEKESESEEVQDEAQQLYKAPAVNSKESTIGAAEDIKEKFLQKEDDPLVPREDAHVESIEIEKKSAREGVQDEDQQLYMSEEITTGVEDAELLENIKASEVVNCSVTESTIGATEEQEEKFLQEEDKPLVLREGTHIASTGKEKKAVSEEVQDEGQQLYEAPAVNSKESTIGLAEETEEKFLHEALVVQEEAHVASIETEKKSESEEAQDEDQEVYKSEEITTGAEDAKLLKNIKSIEVVNCSETRNLKTLEDEKSLSAELEKENYEDHNPFNDSSRCDEACDTFTATGNTTLEQEDATRNYHSSLKEDIKTDEVLENVELAQPPEQHSSANDSVGEHQSNEVILETNKTKTDDCSNSIKDQSLESTGEKIEGKNCQKSGKEMNEEVKPMLDAKNQINEAQDGIETIKDVILTQELSKGIEKNKESETIKEQIIKEENRGTELQKKSTADEIVNKAADSYPVANMNLEAANLQAAENLNLVSEAADNYDEKTDTPPVQLVMEEENAKDVQPYDAASDEKSPGIKIVQTIPQEQETNNEKLEETSGVVSQLMAELKERAILEKPNFDEVEEVKTSDALSKSNKQEVGTEISGESPTVEKTDTGRIEEVHEVLETTSESKDLIGEAVSECHTVSNQTLHARSLQDRLQSPSDAQDSESTSIVENSEDESKRKDELQVNQNLDCSFGIGTSNKEEICFEKENTVDFQSSRLKLKVVKDEQDDNPDEKMEDIIALGGDGALVPEEMVFKSKHSDSPSESEKNIELEKPMKYILHESPKAVASDSRNSDKEPEDLLNPPSTFEKTEMKDEHIGALTTKLKHEENQKAETNEANRTLEKELSSEKLSGELQRAGENDKTQITAEGKADECAYQDSTQDASVDETLPREAKEDQYADLHKLSVDVFGRDTDAESMALNDEKPCSDPEPVENIEARDSSASAEKPQPAEDIKCDSDSSSIAEAPKEEIKNITELPINVASSIYDVSEEDLQENIDNADRYDDKTDPAPVEDPSLEETQLDDKSATDINVTSDDKSPEGETTHTVSLDDIDVVKLKKTSGMVSQCITTVHEQEGNQSVKTVENSDVDEAEKAEERQNINEHDVKEESCTTELQSASKSEEESCTGKLPVASKLNKVVDKIGGTNPKPTLNTGATDCYDNTETLKLESTGNLIWETETSSNLEAPVEEIKKDIGKPINVTSSALEESEGNIGEEYVDEVDERKDRTDTKPIVKVTEETSSEEVQLAEKYTADSDTASEKTVGELEKVTERGNISEHHTKEESCFMELQLTSQLEEESCTRVFETASNSDKDGHELKETNLQPILNIEATDSSENAETVELESVGKYICETEATSNVKEPEEEIKKDVEKLIDVTRAVAEESKQNPEEGSIERDMCKDEIDTAPLTLVTEETSSEEVQLAGKSARDFDSTKEKMAWELEKAENINEQNTNAESFTTELQSTTKLEEDSRTRELQRASQSDENRHNMIDANQQTTVNLEATGPSDNQVTRTPDSAEKFTGETEASFPTKHVNLTSAVVEESKESIQQEKIEVDSFKDKGKAAAVSLFTEETSFEEVQLPDKSPRDFDTILEKNIKEESCTILEEESDTAELQLALRSNENGHKIKDTNPHSMVNTEATDSSEVTDSAKPESAENLMFKTEASSALKTPEKETNVQDPINITSSVFKESNEDIKEISIEIDTCKDKGDTAAVSTVTEETSFEEAQLAEQSPRDFDTTPEQAPGELKKAEGGESTNEQNIKEDIYTTELYPKSRSEEEGCSNVLQMPSESDEIGQEIKDTDPHPIVDIEATAPSEKAETRKPESAENFTCQTEASSEVKEPEEELNDDIEETINVTSAVVEKSKEDTGEGNIEVDTCKDKVDTCKDKVDTAPVALLTEELSFEKVQLPEKSPRDFDTTTEKVVWELEETEEREIMHEENIKEDSSAKELHSTSLTEKESCSKELQMSTDSDENGQESMSTNSRPTVNSEATDSSEEAQMITPEPAEKFICITEESSKVKEPEEEIKEDVEKPISIASAVAEEPKEISGEENMDVDTCKDKTDTATETLVTEKKSSEEVHLADNSLRDIDTTSEKAVGKYDGTGQRNIINGQNVKEEICTIELQSSRLEEESCPRELQMASNSTERFNEIIDTSAQPVANVEATDSSESTETMKSESAKIVILEMEASSDGKAPEDEISKGFEKPIDVNSSISDKLKEIIGLEDIKEVDACKDKRDSAEVTLVTKETSWEERQLADKSIGDFETTSDDMGPEIETTHTGQQFEEDSGKVSQVITTVRENTGKEKLNLERSAEIEVEESKREEEPLVNESLECSSTTISNQDPCLQMEKHRELEASNIELELIEDKQNDNPDEVQNEESTPPEEATPVELQENLSMIISAGSPPEGEESMEPIQCSLEDEGKAIPIIKFEKTEEALVSLPDTDMPEALEKSEEKEMKVEDLRVATTESRAEESQTEKPVEADETIKNEFSKEKATEDKEVVIGEEKPKHTPSESKNDATDLTEAMNLKDQEVSAHMLGHLSATKPLQEDIPNKANENTVDEKHPGSISANETPNGASVPHGSCIKEEGECIKDEVNKNIIYKSNGRTIDDPESLTGTLLQEKEEHSSRERKMTVNEAEIHDAVTTNKDGEIQDASVKLNVLSHINDSGIQIQEKHITMGLANASEFTQDIQKQEKASLLTLDKQIPDQPDSNESRKGIESKYVPLPQQDPTTKGYQTKAEELKPENASVAGAEAKEPEYREETRTASELKTENPMRDSAKIPAFDLLQGSTKGTSKVDEHMIEEKEPTENKEELHADKAEAAKLTEAMTDEDNDGEEEGDENRKLDSGSDAPVMVESSRDIDVNIAAQKKHHNILSSVGSKVKHSIAKVTKAITGKCVHPNPPSSKESTKTGDLRH